ncbi:MAG: flavodoxin domain-containing protein, partial [Candidatus Omnitrophica bacterium]|nr:flavodoxin domain-containing protein [Candidatus Omnitrophota bacterium]
MEKKALEILKKSGTDIQSVVRESAGGLNKDQLAWLSGYFAGSAETHRQLSIAFAAAAGGEMPLPNLAGGASPAGDSAAAAVTVLVASHSGNGTGFARRVSAAVEQAGYRVKMCSMAEFKPRDLKNEKNVLVIISTHGEGVPPPAAEEMFEFLAGNRAPRLDGLNFSVLALGDKTYVYFCKAGIEIDQALERLGGRRITERVDCDADFAEAAEGWLSRVLAALKTSLPVSDHAAAALSVTSTAVKPSSVTAAYTAKNPFMARVLSKVNLNGRGSEKETYHIELSLAESGITYQPGDACGLLPRNADRMVAEVLAKLNLRGGERTASSETLADVLRGYELTVLTPDVLKKHNAFAKSAGLEALLADVARLREYLYGRDLIDLLTSFPVAYTAADLLTVLRPIPARLYSIASSPSTYQDEVHLLVSAVRYNAFGRHKEGVGSTFWADRILENEQVPVYIKSNEGFRLPADGNVPVIMVGPGSGVAPFRAFVEERGVRGGKGKNWLFFGNPHFATDFLYQTEWQAHLKKGLLTRMDVAFSRDQDEKIYVQHKITQQAKDVFACLEEGAYIYVCGDTKRMAPDVYQAFVGVAQQEGGFSTEKAEDYMKALKRGGRYLEDV